MAALWGKVFEIPRKKLPSEAKDVIKRRLAELLSARPEIRFACVFGSFQEAKGGSRDVDVGVWVDAQQVGSAQALDYELDLAAELERQLHYPVDVKLLNYAPLGLRFAATSGELLLARGLDEWHTFRETTWLEYWDFLPINQAMLKDLLRP